MNMHSAAVRQRGLSLITILLFGILAVVFFTIGMRVLPSVIEYRAITRTLTMVATSGVSSAVEAQRAFDRQATIDDIVSVKGKDILIERTGNALVLSAAYEKRVPLFGPVSLMIEYEARSSQK